MDNERVVLMGLFAAYIVTLLFMLLPDSTEPVMSFPFLCDYKLSLRTYVYFASERIGLMIVYFTFGYIFTKYLWAISILFFLEAIGLIDYFITYNWTWFYIGELSVEFALIKVLTFTGIILYITFKKNDLISRAGSITG